MPPLVLADSDDEGEELLDPEQIAIDEQPGTVAEPGTATGNNASTTSSEELQEKIRRAEADLIAPTASMGHISGQSPMLPSSSSKRRHTAAFIAEPSISPEKRVKRTKTSQKTYSRQRSSAPRIEDEGAFSRFRDDEEVRAPSSRSARFTEHSGAASSSHGLPAGSLHADFLGHQPHVMFRDTGSTAVDNESSQQRMIEQARNSNKGASTSVSKLIESDEPKSSSFPWSASVHTQSTKKAVTNEDGVPASGDAHDDDHNDEVDRQPPSDGQLDTLNNHNDEAQAIAKGENKHADPAPPGVDSEVKAVEAEQPESSAQLPQRDLIIAPKSSPRVEITLPAARVSAEAEDGPEQTQRASKGRKRKAKADESEKLSSESQAVGLPKEMYVPRPSKRRATHVVEEVIDYSIKPEKAAKARRTKTTTVAKPTIPEASTPKGIRRGSHDGTLSGKTSKAVNVSPSKSVTDSHASQGDAKMCNTPSDIHANKPASDTPQGPASKSLKAEADEDKIFVKPAMPKSSKKTKRSHTTIFEDHIDLTASQRRPSLSQQQAARKEALATAKDETDMSKSTQRRRKVIEDDEDEDDDDDDEKAKLAHDSESAKAESNEPKNIEPEEQPTKKRRGRPPSKKAPAKSAEVVEEDPEDEGENVAPVPEDTEPKKCGRGRPAKKSVKAAVSLPDEGLSKQAEEAPQDHPEPEMPANVSSQLGNGATSGAQEPTPSPEKRSVPAKVSTPPPKSSPASHSPIKSSSTVPLRVGLSKRQRIPSLLRVMKPPTKR